MEHVNKIEFSKKYFVLADIDSKIAWNIEECIMSRYGNIENFVTRYTNYLIYMPGEGEFSDDYIDAKKLKAQGQDIHFFTVDEFWNIVNAAKLIYLNTDTGLNGTTPKEMVKLLEEYEALSKDYISKGISSPYYFLNIVDELINQAILYENKELVSYLLQYKKSKFSLEDVSAAEADRWDLELELRKPYPSEIHDKTLLKEYANAHIKTDFASLKAGDSIEFGTYPQGKLAGAGSILWDVLEVDDDTALLISHFALDSMVYNKHLKPCTWALSTLRQWLNDEFLDNAFSDEQKMMIVATHLRNENNPEYDTDGGADTTDKVFILSLTEIDRLLDSEDKRKAYPTRYAVDRRVYVDENGYCIWWARTPGRFDYNAGAVLYNGILRNYGYYVDYNLRAVRPALRIKIRKS